MEKALHLLRRNTVYWFPPALLTISFYHSALSCTPFGDGLSQIFPVAFAEVELE